ncbi:hypothetical protein B0T25DRAFT_545432 [Lasiosphaeria hispida]|uniref:Uncharacterized protein n=1 Tax=Lasiosphaeria hispida TaxID=260671 RepID=A0AAJ0HJF5_9PEZI|nr:hypothetical protein B0T25DRAFT_545432 [Lasiosphaeria hispida]
MARQFQFVAVSNPTEAPSSESKKLVYSHAFRQAHAQRRREQTEKHRKEIASAPVNKVFTISEEVVSSPLSQVLNSNKDPFSSMARPISAVEYFLLNHYVHVIVPFTVGHCGLFDHPGDHKTQLLREWVGLAITDEVFMIAAILLSTCRYILQAQPGNLIILQLALQYKQTCLQTLQQEMNTSAPVSIMTVAKALALALDEVTVGEHTIARKHLKGVLAMVDSSGGAGELGLTGLLERMYRKFMGVFKLELKDAGIDLLCNKTLTQG